MNEDAIGPGLVVLVVGPSGAGKDTLIRAAQARLGADARFHFVRRVVTRTPSPTDEDHDAIDESDFDALVASGATALVWRAHGLAYALPRDMDMAVRAGRVAVANASRAAVEPARRRYAHRLVIEVTAPLEILLARLLSRGRESEDEIRRRLSRPAPTFEGPDVLRVENGGELAPAIDRFSSALERAAASVILPTSGE